MYSSARLDDSRSGLSATHAFVPGHVRLLRPVELGGRKPEPSDAQEFGHQGIEASRHAVVRDERLNDRLVSGPWRRKERPIRGGLQERRLLALTELVEPRAEHVGEQLILHDLAIAADRALVARRPQIRDLDGSRGGFLVGHDRVARARMFRHVEYRPRPLRRRIGERQEVLRDHPPDGVAIDVADHDHGHEVRTIPIAIEPHQLLACGALDNLGSANGSPVRIARPFELDAADLVPGALVGAQVHPPLGKDDRTLAFDAGRVEGGAACPVLEDRQRAVEGAWHIGRHAERVLAFRRSSLPRSRPRRCSVRASRESC